ncbi:MAG: CHAT domain-containing protein [Bacteroidota bacterium]
MEVKIIGKKNNQEVQQIGEEHNEFEMVAEYEIFSDRSEGSTIETATLEEGCVTELILKDGTVWLANNEELEFLLTSKNRDAVQDGVLTISSNINISVDGTDRGIWEDFDLKKIKIFNPLKSVKDKISGWVKDKAIDILSEEGARLLAKKLDENLVDKEGLFLVGSDFKFTAFEEKKEELDLTKPVLLFVHGTTSTTKGSFGHLYDTKSWKRIVESYKKNILAFDHWTWSVSPIKNALTLMELLPKGIEVHLVTSSRGGLVGEYLSRCHLNKYPYRTIDFNILRNAGRENELIALKGLNEQAEEKQIKVSKYVRISCPANGTTLISERADRFLNLLLNAVGLIGGFESSPVYRFLKEFIIAFVGQRGNPEHLPGIEAMIPGSPVLQVLNQYRDNHSYAGELCIISAHAGNSSNVGRALLYFATKFFFRTDNDFVVDTNSMYQGFRRSNDIYYSFFSDGKIQHLSYFKNEGVRNSIWTALNTEKGKKPVGFKVVKKDDYAANRGISFARGRYSSKLIENDDPVVILIPGIMGSNLDHKVKQPTTKNNTANGPKQGYEEIWLDYDQLIKGGLERIFSLVEDIRAESIIRTSYQKLGEYLKTNKYQVVVLPYDWRQSVKKASDALKDQVNDILEKEKKLSEIKGQPVKIPIHIVAHSMGGLVVRQLMLSHKATWEQLNEQVDFRCLLLGTPWYGSYLMAQTLLGKSSTIKLLALADQKNSRKDLLRSFVKFPGLWELMPLQGHHFEEKELWEALLKVRRDNSWQMPNETILKKFARYKEKILNTDFDLSKVYYIAGKAKETPHSLFIKKWSGIEFPDKGGKELLNLVKQNNLQFWNSRVVFMGTGQGDGSVTWKAGIPKELVDTNRVYYMETTHGELANDDDHFPGILELLSKGRTDQLPDHPSSYRSSEDTFELPDNYVFSNDRETQLRQLLQFSVEPKYERKTSSQPSPLKVTFKNGDLKFAKYPVIIGHFKDDFIIGAGSVLNYLLDNQLLERRNLGQYPGAIGTNLVILPTAKNDVGAIVVGMGTAENLTASQLRNSVEKACVEYILRHEPGKPDSSKENIQVSSLLVGSDYGNLSLANSMNYILEGVTRANQSAKSIDKNYPLIDEVEFIELYTAKANNAYFILNKMKRDLQERMTIELKGGLQKVDGNRFYSPFPYDHESGWWQRISALVQEETVKIENEYLHKEYVKFSATTNGAKVEVRNQFTNPLIIDHLLSYDQSKLISDKDSLKAVFELFIPNDFKTAFRNQQNIIWVLDEKTAQYPLEMLNLGGKDESPLCINAGMIRQLASSDEIRTRQSTAKETSLVIGDPILGPNCKIPQLQAAKREANEIVSLLEKKRYNPVSVIRKNSGDVLRKLFNTEYQILHVACHGVVNYGKLRQTGILLSKDLVLTAAEIQQIKTPELVFINCCHLGKVDADDEQYFREKYKLAANIGTQFIKNGVKAIIVAGWVVDDNAARYFANRFYDYMFGGFKFGEAVLKARKDCYKRFGDRNNTWGAYQCYGDPHYTLENNSNSTDKEKKYTLEKEILIELEVLLNSAKFSSKGNYDSLMKWLREISQAIQDADQKLKTDRVLEMEVDAYYTMGEYKTGIEKFEQLMAKPGTNYSMNSFKTYTNIRSNCLPVKHDNLVKELKSLKSKSNSGDYKDRIDDLELLLKDLGKEKDQVLESFNDLKKMYETSDVLGVIGSFYKNIVHWSDNKEKDQMGYLQDGADNYQEGYRKEKDIGREGHYQLTNWIVIEEILRCYYENKAKRNKENKSNGPSQKAISTRASDIKKTIGEDHRDYVKAKIEYHTPENKDNLKNQKDVNFWDCIKLVNYLTCQLFFVKDDPDKLDEIADEIEEYYRKAWKKGGSIRNLDSEKAHFTFIRKSIEGKHGTGDLTETIRRLLRFFNQLDIRI